MYIRTFVRICQGARAQGQGQRLPKFLKLRKSPTALTSARNSRLCQPLAAGTGGSRSRSKHSASRLYTRLHPEGAKGEKHQDVENLP